MNGGSKAFEVDFSSLRTVILASELQQVQLMPRPLHQGETANVFNIEGWSRLVGKIYHRPTIELAERIDAMLEHPLADRSAVSWPADQLLAVGSYQTFVGFAMPRFEMGVPLPEFWLPGARLLKLGTVQHNHRLQVARSLANAVARIHACGQVIGSLRPDNVVVNPFLKATLAACDTWQFRTPNRLFPCRRVHSAYTTPELRNDESTLRNQGHDCFALGVILFQLLHNGTHPLTSKISGQQTSGRLRDLFQRCFETGLRDPQQCPTAKTWETAMSSADGNLRTCSADPQHRFGREFDRCPMCGAGALADNATTTDTSYDSFGIVIPDQSGRNTVPTEPERMPTQPTQTEQPLMPRTDSRRQPVIADDAPGVTLTNVDFAKGNQPKDGADKTTLRPQAPETKLQSNADTRNSQRDEPDVSLSQVDLPDKGKKTVLPQRGRPTFITPPAAPTKIAKNAPATMLTPQSDSKTSLPPRGANTKLPQSPAKGTMISEEHQQQFSGQTKNLDYGIEVDGSQEYDTVSPRNDQSIPATTGDDVRLTQIPGDSPKRKTSTGPQTSESAKSSTGPTEQQRPQTATATAFPSGSKSVLGETKTAQALNQPAPTQTAEVVDQLGTATETAEEIQQGGKPITQTLTDHGSDSPFSGPGGDTVTAKTFDPDEGERGRRSVWMSAAIVVLLLGIGGMVAYKMGWLPFPSTPPGETPPPPGPWMPKVERYFYPTSAVHQRVATDLDSASDDDQEHFRYLSLDALHNNQNIKNDELKEHRKALVQLVQHFSPKGKDMSVTPVKHSDDMVYRINLRDWGDNGRQVWDTILKHYPYAVHHGYCVKAKNELKKAAASNAKKTQCDVVVIRGDWFMVAGWDSVLYSQITNRTKSDNKKGDLGDALKKAAERYDEDVTLAQAAAEFGFYDSEKFKKAVQGNQKLMKFGLQTIVEDAKGTIPRRDWQNTADGPSLFQITARELGFGPPYSVIR